MARETKEARRERYQLELWRFVDLLRRAGNQVEEEVKFHPGRKWRIDLVVKGISSGTGPCRVAENVDIALEIEGRGRHQSFYGYSADIEKYNEVTIAGYRLLRITRDMIANGDALELLARAGVNVQPRGVDSQSPLVSEGRKVVMNDDLLALDPPDPGRGSR